MLSGCLPTESADYCMLINEWAWLWTRVYIKPESALEFIFGVRGPREMKIWCITGMCMLKVVSCETNSVDKGLKEIITI